MPSVPGGSHEGMRALLPALHAGILDPEREAALRHHLAECESCRGLAADLAPEDHDPSADAGHLSAELLARWDRSRRSLRGLERVLVRAHLERCAECREDLEALGHSPVLEVVPELEPGTTWLESPPRSEPHRVSEEPAVDPIRPVIRIVTGRARKRRPAFWAFGGWATAAAAAAFLVVTRVGVTPPSDTSSQAGGVPPSIAPSLPPPATEAPSPRSAPGRLGIAKVAQLPITTRAEGLAPDSMPITTVDASTRLLALVPPELPDLAPADRILVTLLSPSRSRLAAQEFTAAQLRGVDAAIVFDAGDAGLPTGIYRLRLEIAQSPRRSSETIEQAFRILNTRR